MQKGKVRSEHSCPEKDTETEIGYKTGGESDLGWVDVVFLLFHCQPVSAGADENQAVLA